MKQNASTRDDFTARRGGRGNSRVWQWQADPRITIRERVNASGGLGYRVTFPKGVTGGPVLHMQSKDMEQAKVLARSRGREFRESKSTALILGDAEKIQAASALRILKKAEISVSLDRLAEDYGTATAHLKPFNLDVTRGAELLSKSLTAAKQSGKTLAELIDYAAKRLSPKGGAKTVKQLADEMIELKQGWHDRGDLRPASLRDFKNRAGKISKDLGEFLLVELTKDRLQAWLVGLTKLAPRSLKNYRMVLAEMLRYAVQKKHLLESPIDELTRYDVKEIEGSAGSARVSVLSPAQAEQLLLAAYENPEWQLGPAVVLGLFAGIRTEELKRLKWDAVRLNEPEPFVVIGPEIAKKRRIRNVTLPANAVAWLRAWPEKREGAITRSSHTNDFQKRFQKLSTAAKITWENNAMRHSFGSYHFARYGNSIETARLLGHKQDDSVLFAHYRALATKEQGEIYFGVLPPKSAEIVIDFPAQG